MKRIIFLIGTFLALPVFASMPTNTHYKYTKVYEAAFAESVSSKPAINSERDIVFFRTNVSGVQQIVLSPANSDGTRGSPIIVADSTPGMSFEFVQNGLLTENKEISFKSKKNKLKKLAAGDAEPVISSRTGNFVYIAYYEGAGIDGHPIPQVSEACGTISSQVSWTMRFNLYRARVNIVTGEVEKTLILATGKSYCDGPRYDVVSIQAPFSINSSGQVAISAYVHRREEFSVNAFRHILVSSPSDPAGITGIPRPRVVVARHTTEDEGGYIFHSSHGSPQINDLGDIALLATSYVPETNPQVEGKFLYFIPSNTSTLKRLAVESNGLDPGHYAQLSGRPSINNSKQVALFIRKTEGEFQNPGILIANASCGRSGQPNCPQGEEDFDWIIGDTRNNENKIIEKYQGEFKEYSRDILLGDKATKKSGANNSVLFPYMQGFSFGANSYVEKSNNGNEVGGEIIEDSIFSSNFYNPDGGLILRMGSRIKGQNNDLIVDYIGSGRYSNNKNGTLAVAIQAISPTEPIVEFVDAIYEIRPCEADGVCIDFGQATFAPDVNGDGVVDLLRHRPVVARVKLTDSSNGLAKSIEAIPDPLFVGSEPYSAKIGGSDFSDSTYYEIPEFLALNSQLDFSFSTTIDNETHAKSGHVDIWTRKNNNFTITYLPLNCPVFLNSATSCVTPVVVNPSLFETKSVLNFKQMFPVLEADVDSKLIPERKNSSGITGFDGVVNDIKKVWFEAKNASSRGFYTTRAGIGIVPDGYFVHRFGNSSSSFSGYTVRPINETKKFDLKFADFASLVEESYFESSTHEFTHLFSPIGDYAKKHIGRATVDGYNFFVSGEQVPAPVWRSQEIFQAVDGPIGRRWPGNHSWVDNFMALNKRYIVLNETKKLDSNIENIVFGFIFGSNSVQSVEGLRQTGIEESYEGDSNLRAIVRNAKGEITKNIPLPAEFEAEALVVNEENGSISKKHFDVNSGPYVLSIPVSIYDASYSIELNGSPIFSENINLHVLDTMIDYIPDDGFKSNPELSRANLKNALVSSKSKAANSDYSGASIDLNNNFKKLVNRLVINVSNKKSEDVLGVRFYLADILAEVSTATQRLAISASDANQPVQLFEISSDKDSYSSGERAIIKAQEIISLDDKEYEYALVAKVDGNPQRIDRINEKLFQSETSSLSTGLHVFSIEVFKQNKRFAKNIEESINKVDGEILFIDRELERETDQSKIDKLVKRRNLLLQRNEYLKNKLQSQRKKLGLEYVFEFNVN
ncbi:MAG: hypothetical protein M9962_06775 [Oligoflexia bacterium]|nr:hypothetical protein [Oligoflexia bacterium]